MANSFSDLMASSASATYDPTYKRVGVVAHGRMRRKRALVNWPGAAGVAANDTMTVATFRSSDRIYELYLSQNAAMGAGSAMAIGAYRSAIDHVPVAANLLRANMFATAMSLTGPFARVELFTSSAQLRNIDRGLPFWQLVNLAAGSTVFAKDPQIDFDLVFTVTTALAATLQTQVCEVMYSSEG